jgi:hypothetical protein
MPFSLYQLCHYIHVLGAFGLSAAMAVEYFVLVKLKTIDTAERALDWIGLYSAIRWLGGFSLVGLLVPGIYMAITAWPRAGWVQVAFGCFIALGAIGGTMTGSKLAQLEKALLTVKGQLPLGLRNQASRRSYGISWSLRLCIVLAVVALMVLKPQLNVSLAIALFAVLVGGVAGWLTSRQPGAQSRS